MNLRLRSRRPRHVHATSRGGVTALVAVTVVSLLPAVAPALAAGAGPRTASGSALASSYSDPCEVTTGGLDLRGLTVGDLYERDRRTVSSDPVPFTFSMCSVIPEGDHDLRVDLHARTDAAADSDYDESARRSVIVRNRAGTWTYEVVAYSPFDGTSTSVGSGPATAVMTGGVATGVRAEVPASDVAAAGPAPTAGRPSLALRACTADRDCGPVYVSDALGRNVTEGTPEAGVDYLPDPALYPVTYPSECQVTGLAATAPGAQPNADSAEAAARAAAPRVRRPDRTPDDPAYPSGGTPGVPGSSGQWNLRQVGAEGGWDVTIGDSAVTVAVLDSGFDGRHLDLAGAAAAGRDFLPTRTAASRDLDITTDTDLGGHGTFVSSLIAARTDDGAGMAGLGWNTRVLVARVLDAEGCAEDEAIAAAMDWAVSNGATVLNLSLGGTSLGPLLDAAGRRAIAAGVVPVAASGNSGAGITEYPAAYASFVSVAATTSEQFGRVKAASYSTANAAVELAAPGGGGTGGIDADVLGACFVGPTAGRGYCREAGTSFAAPLVAAGLALVRDVDPVRTAPGMRQLLTDTALDIEPLGRDDATGAGQLDLGRALALLDSRTDPLAVAGGTDAVTAGVAASRTVFTDGGAGLAVLARDDVFADALVGAALAQERGPMLFTPSGQLATATRDEIRRVLPAGSTVFLLGGENALSPAVEQEVASLGYVARRLAGSSRIGTAIAVARVVGPASGRILVASAENWPDAIAGGAYAARTHTPLVLSWPDDADEPRSPGLLAALADFAPNDVVLLGGPGALSDEVFADIARTYPVRRVSGTNRFATAVEVSRVLWGRAGAAGDALTIVNGDRPDGWAYGLAASPIAAILDAPLLLVNDGFRSIQPRAYLHDVLGYRIDRAARGILVGPPSSDPTFASTTQQRLRELLGG